MLMVTVEIRRGKTLVRSYQMNHDDESERRVLGQQVRDSIKAGQFVLTYPTAHPAPLSINRKV